MSNKKNQAAIQRELEAQAAKLLGKQVSREKARALLAVTLAACALPMVLGIRLWSQIPLTVPSGLIGTDGRDDSLPRWVVAFGLPGLMCILDLLAHWTLRMNQKRQTIPPAYSRLVGRWGFPIISVLFCSGMILQAVGQDLTLPFVTPCVLGLALMMLGGHMWDCPRDARIALRFSSTVNNPTAWKAVHRLAGWLWMAAGLVVIAGVMVTATSTWVTAAVVIAALLIPVVYAARGFDGLK